MKKVRPFRHSLGLTDRSGTISISKQRCHAVITEVWIETGRCAIYMPPKKCRSTSPRTVSRVAACPSLNSVGIWSLPSGEAVREWSMAITLKIQRKMRESFNAITCGCANPGSAHAQWVVSEPTNLAQSISSTRQKSCEIVRNLPWYFKEVEATMRQKYTMPTKKVGDLVQDARRSERTPSDGREISGTM